MNWFKYRLPHSDDIVAGASPFLVNGLQDKGFVITPFLAEDCGVSMIPFSSELDMEYRLEPNHSFISDSTPKETYLKEVSAIIDHYKGQRGKTVASRCIKIETEIDLNATFSALCSLYPDAFVFMFSTEETGTWIGASPELLLSLDSDGIHTMALAGTRPADQSGEWDDKNIDEQQMVADYIVNILEKYCDNIDVKPSFTKKAGNVEHICTPVDASNPRIPLSDFLIQFSPTPALCGSNKEESLMLIEKLENHDRELYGGFCGPYNIDGKTSLFVIVRTAKCNPDSVCLYAGGGITRDSSPLEEWEETEMKSNTIIKCIKSKKK